MVNKEVMASNLAAFETYMLNMVVNYTAESETLKEAITYSLTTGGKRFRPMLLLTTIQFGKGNLEQAFPIAAALEWIHTYSLIHDDLPAMDNDDFRRGKPTTHKQFDEAIAILAGDSLLTAAFEIILDQESLSFEKRVHLARNLSQASGANGMVAGQMRDIEGENKELSITELADIHQKKTGALIKYAIEAGCLLADVAEDSKDLLNKYADHLGLAYQIHNDLKDVVLDQEATGKKTGQDEELGKNTYPSILGLNEAMMMLEKEIKEASSLITTLKQTANPTEVNLESLDVFLHLLDYVKLDMGV